ncbi:MAG: hypothetical protein HZA28_05930 [Candidatus Omnitrophica bacterium]|nr:hypothetical protein [Candidatus Omnitrophota bacterium]
MGKRKNLFFQGKGLMILSSGLFIILSLTLLQKEASAVPIFARKYQTSCTTCHAGFPKLNAFGESFKRNGYRLPDDETFVKEPPVWLGSEAYKRVWPDAVWPGSIPGSVPLAFRVVGQATFDPSKSTAAGEAKNDFEFPHEIELSSLGTMGDNLSFDLDIAIQDENERASVEKVSLRYDDIFAGTHGIPQDLINLRVGLFDPAAIPFSLHNQNLTASKPTIYDFRISSSAQPKIRDSQSGIEIFGTVAQRLGYAVGVVNGVARSGATSAFTDNNNQKDVYARTEYKFGGLPLNGAAGSGAGDQLNSGFSYFDQGPSVTVGTTGYYGVNQVNAATNVTSQYYRITGFLRANRGRYNMDAVGLYELDDAAAGQFAGTIDKDINTWGFYTEGTAFIYPWLAFVTRYDRLNVGHVSVLGASNPSDNSSRLTLSMPVYARPNLRIVPEASLGLSKKDGDTSDNFKVRLDFAY